MSGLTPAGFVRKTLDEILAEIQAAQLSEISPSLNTSSAGILGQLNGIFADRISELWEVMEDLYRAVDADGAEGDALDILAALTGVTRLAATPSEVTITLTGTPTTLVPLGSIASVADNETVRFATLANATITAATAWVALTTYSPGDIRTNASRIYYCIAAGLSAGAGGPTTTASDITDGTVHWRYLGEGTGFIEAAAEATETGLLAAPAGTLTEIETPVSGWDSANNILDAELGTDLETDPALRLRREQLLRASGSGTVDALESDLRNVEDVTSATVYENVTDVTDVDGVPPHAFEAVLLGGDDDAIAQVIWDNKPAGIQAYGSSSGTAIDSDSNNRIVGFTRPTDKDIYYEIDLEIDPASYVGDALVEEALVTFGDALGVGADVIVEKSKGAVISLAGVLDIAAVRLGFSASPVGTVNLTIDAREISRWDTSRIVVTIV